MVGVHVECVNGKIVGIQFKGLENLFKCQLGPITKYDNILKGSDVTSRPAGTNKTYVGTTFHLRLDES